MDELREFWDRLCDKPGSLRAYYYLLFLTIAETFFYYVRPVNNALGNGENIDLVITLFWVVGIYFALPIFLKTVRLVDIVIYVAACCFYYVSPAIYPITATFVRETFPFFALHTIPFYFVGLTLNFGRDREALLHISRSQLLMTLLFTMLSMTGWFNSNMSGEQMAVSYSVLLPTMFEFYYMTKYRRRSDIIYFLLGISQILMYGTRGPLVCMMLFVAGYLLQNFRNNSVLAINTLLGLGVVYIFLRPIMLVLMFITRMTGLSTRIFESYLDDELINYQKASGREDIHDLLWNHIINDSGGIGYGLGSDRLMGRKGTEYAHNLIYEVWMDFGLYIGSVVLILLLILILRTALKSLGHDRFNLFLMLLVFSVVHSMLSGSYLQDFQIYMFIGYCVSILRAKKGTADEEEDEEGDVTLVVVDDEESPENLPQR